VLGKPIGAKDCVIVGGRDMVEQGKEMVRRPHILISTPGRLADHIESGHQVPLGQIKFLVLDEADRLLDGQYGDQLKTIFSALPKQRQTLLFSATITDALTELKQLALRKPHFWEDPAVSETVIVANLEQSYVLCPVEVKDAFLVYAVNVSVTMLDGTVLTFVVGIVCSLRIKPFWERLLNCQYNSRPIRIVQ